ncbi:MAG: ribonuclease G [Clostridioides sp.]|jgi:hypothetical protein|nr:ribonuclease G [Clostridioides sp.]
MLNETKEVKGWNWGAFMYSIVWGIGNKCYLPLLCLIPIFNIVWVFVCGAKGNEWAYRNSELDAETFMAIQETWNRAGLVMFMISLAVVVLWIIIFILGMSSLSNITINL